MITLHATLLFAGVVAQFHDSANVTVKCAGGASISFQNLEIVDRFEVLTACEHIGLRCEFSGAYVDDLESPVWALDSSRPPTEIRFRCVNDSMNSITLAVPFHRRYGSLDVPSVSFGKGYIYCLLLMTGFLFSLFAWEAVCESGAATSTL